MSANSSSIGGGPRRRKAMGGVGARSRGWSGRVRKAVELTRHDLLAGSHCAWPERTVLAGAAQGITHRSNVFLGLVMIRQHSVRVMVGMSGLPGSRSEYVSIGCSSMLQN